MFRTAPDYQIVALSNLSLLCFIVGLGLYCAGSIVDSNKFCRGIDKPPHSYHTILQFDGVMGLAYAILGFVWLFAMLQFYRDLLQLQFWIGGVALIGRYVRM